MTPSDKVLARAELAIKDGMAYRGASYVGEITFPIIRDLLGLVERQREVIAYACGPTRDVKTPMLCEAITDTDATLARLGEV